MKKLSLILLGVILLTVAITVSAFADTYVKIQVDGKSVTFDGSPFISKGEVMSPVRPLAEKLGGKVSWDDKKKTVWIRKDLMNIEVPVGKAEFYIHRDADFTGIPQKVRLKTATKLVKQRVVIPAKLLAENMGLKSFWDAKSKILTIKSGPVPAGKIKGNGMVLIAPDSIKTVELFSIDDEKIRDCSPEEITTVVTTFNNAKITEGPYIQMIAGSVLKLTLKDGKTIRLSSYGSKTNLIAAIQEGERQNTNHLISPTLAELLLASGK